MTTQKKLLIGGLGALTPVIMNLLAVDLPVLLVNVTALALAGYLIRVVILFYLGGVVAFLHKDEHSPIKLFELGIAAPALITAFLNAGHVEVPKATAQTPGMPAVSGILVPLVYAQTSRTIELKKFSIPEEGPTQQFLRGLTGSTPKNVWFVIVGSHPTLEDAKKQVQELEEKGFAAKGLKGEVFAPNGKNQFYSVVIGANLTQTEAQQLRQRAIAEGLSKDTYLWTFPK